jgi:hypothetical protein
LCDNFGKLVDFAKENNIKLAVNPSRQQLSLPENELKRPKIFALSLRKSERAFAFTPGVGIKHPIRYTAKKPAVIQSFFINSEARVGLIGLVLNGHPFYSLNLKIKIQSKIIRMKAIKKPIS